MKPFAFISYSRYDADIAVDLHRKIERYSFPKEWVEEKNRPQMDKYVRPVFLDLVDLSIKHRSFTDELRENLRDSRYLIVVCSQNASKSNFVKKEIDYFLQTHNDDSSLIVAVYVDLIFSGMHPTIDEIVATRNCPIYVTGRGDAGHVGRKYCFYHILEFLLKVDFDKLYNRYEEYKKKKKKRITRFWTILTTLIISILAYGWHNQIEKTKAEEERTRIEHERVEFEMGVFPYSLVVGYVDNFLFPVMKALNDSCPSEPHMFIFMPKDSIELDNNLRPKQYTDYLNHHYLFKDYITENIHIPGRFRESSITKINIDSCSIPLYKDDARTVLAFKSVIDYKLGNVKIGMSNPVPVPKEVKDSFTVNYTKKFISFSNNKLSKYKKQVHFVCDTIEFGRILDSLGIYKYN